MLILHVIINAPPPSPSSSSPPPPPPPPPPPLFSSPPPPPPPRLDVQDRNCGQKVIGYAVYVNGILRSKVEDPIGSHSEIADMENGMEYQVQVRCVCVCVCVSESMCTLRAC